MDRIISHRARRTALLSASALALVFAAAPEHALGQTFDRGFQGTPVVNAGAATVTPTLNTTTVNVANAQTVITWTPTSTATSGTIDFLPNGTTAAFTSTTLEDYTVLNRIIPGGTARIGLNGSITSTVVNPDLPPAPGGNVWFYTPNGFIVGSTAVISVGGLLMTTNDIGFTVDPASGGAVFTNANGAVELRGAAGSTGSIVNNGTIVGNNPNSYIALVAPRIEQRGFVSADRSIAYVAGEQVDLTIDAGLFGITVLTGTSDAEGIVHTGSTTGSASTGFFDRKAISFVAIPKNDAMTMLLSGSVGYAPADSAVFDGSSIVLLAGGGSAPDANVRVGTGLYSNRMSVSASGAIDVATTGPNGQGVSEVRFREDSSLSGNRGVTMTAAAGSTIVAEQSLSLSSQQPDGDGGAVTVRALGASGNLGAGTIDVGTYLDLSASGNGLSSDDGAIGFESIGGTVTVAADGGTIFSDAIYTYASASGGSGTTQAGDGRGGTVSVSAGYGGTIATDYLLLNANGTGGYSPSVEESGPSGIAGAGHGGTVNLADSGTALGIDTDGGSLAIGSLRLDASADGGYTSNFGTGRGGDAFGGTVNATIDRQSQSWSNVDVTANAHDGNTALDPVGGTVNFTVAGGVTLSVGGPFTLEANAVAGINGGPGAFATGGTINLAVREASSLLVSGTARLSAEASTGGFFFDTPDSTADLTGGTITMTVDGDSVFEAYDLSVDVDAENVGAATLGGFARGGTINLTASNGGTIATAVPEGPAGLFQLTAGGFGTNGASPTIATGGTINVSALSGGQIEAVGNAIELYAGAEALSANDSSGDGVIAAGGTIAIDAIGGTFASPIVAEAMGRGGDAAGAGGSGTGGDIVVRVLEGGEIFGNFAAAAYGAGGQSLTSGRGGDGRGGSLTLSSDASAIYTAFSLDFEGYGQGAQAASGTGGDGYGGSARIDILGGDHDWASATLAAYARGATSQGSGSFAGSAFGDATGLQFHVGGGASLTIRGDLALDATAFTGGDGVDNVAIGGTAGVLVDGGAALSARAISIDASAYLGEVEFDPTAADTTPTVEGGTASLIADGGAIDAPSIEVIADADTAGALVNAGSVTGGTAIVGAANGGSIGLSLAIEVGGGLTLSANGYGGEGPSAADAKGGTATLYTAGGTIDAPFDLEVHADALGGEYAGFFNEFALPAKGFDATGGTASIEMRAGGGTITVPNVFVSAIGDADSISAVEGTGGSGTGGTARLSVASGTLVTGAIDLLVDGRGGAAEENPSGGAAFVSGDGIGGTAELTLAGGAIQTSGVELSANGFGGQTVGDTAGETPSLAGAGQGGAASFTASGGTLTDTGVLDLHAAGFGAAGAFNPNAGNGGAGGSATGGEVSLIAPAGSTAALGIAGAIRLNADATGGSGGFASAGARGNGGNAAGGSATVSLADIPFDFGIVAANANGFAGTGPNGSGIGGDAAFELVDSTSATVTPRRIATLSLQATGSAGAGGGSVGGQTVFIAEAGAPGSGLAITGSLFANASGGTAPAGLGFTGSIAGAPVTVGGIALIQTPGSGLLDIVAPGALNVTGNLTVDVGGSFTSTGIISTAANARVIAPAGISMTDLSAGGTTLLRAVNGPVTVSANLTSGGLVTVLGRSVNLVSLGALSFADADATAGDLAIRTAGDLDLVTVDATGAVTLVSTGGDVHNTGAVNGTDLTFIAGGDVISDTAIAANGNLTVDAGGLFVTPTASASATGNVSLSADLGLNLASVTSGGTTLLRADAGAVNVASLTSPGAVTASGRLVAITSPGALTFTNAAATAGNLQVNTVGALTIGQGSAAGTTSLTSTGGAVNVTNLLSGGLVTARGTAVSIGSTDALSFADLDATAGNVNVQTAGNLAVSTVDATGLITLISTGGSLSASGALNGVGITLGSFTDLTLINALATSGAISLASTSGAVSATSPVTAGGNLSVSGLTGVTLGAATSGGTTALTAANGAVAVTNLASVGAVTASGRSVAIASTGVLNVASAQATAGNLAVATGQGLTVGAASATGSVGLSASGNLATTGLVTGAGITLAGANVTTGGAVQSSAALALSAQQLLTVNALATGTAIAATSGDIVIGPAGRLGSRGLTQTLRVTSQSASAPINFGGTGTSGQFSLDQSEAARLFADQSITLASTTGDVRIGALAMSYGGASTANIGSGGTLKIDTGGNVTVDGAVILTTSSAADTFSIDPQRIEVVAGPGSIAMLGAGGAPFGSLVLEAGTVVVADQPTIGAIGSAGDIVTIRRLLDQPTATRSDSGFLQAGSIGILAGSALYIQNTGASVATGARRGFTAGAVNIDTGSASTKIVINGVITTPNGTLTGRQAIDSITINGVAATAGGAFDPLSTINGCVIGLSCTSQGIPTSSDLTSPPANDLGNPGLSGELIILADNEPLISPPLVDEPITGVGNDDLWQVHCDPEEDKGTCPAGEGETTE